jgi:hypothetical protein
MAIFPKPNVLLFDASCGLTDSNRWRECSGAGLHALPGAAYAAPAYGIAMGPSGAPYILAGGAANNNATLSTDFYLRAPTTGLTIALVQKFTAPAAADFVFSTVNAAVTRGMAVDFSTADRLRIRAYDAAGAVMSCTMTADGPLTGRTRVVVLAMAQAGSLARAWVDRDQVAATFAGSLNPIAYDAAVVPTLFSIVGGAGNYNDGNAYLFGIDNRVWTHSEAVAFCDYYRDVTL